MKEIARGDDGVTNVVSMIMIIAILTSLMGMIFATYLPAWGKDIEVQTQNDAMDSFFDLRSNLDTLSLGGDSGTSLASKMRMGSDGGPLFGFGRSTGSLSIDGESGSVAVADQGGSIYGQGRGVIQYRSDHLYVEDRTITLEGGAIILDQSGTLISKGPPNIIVKKDVNTDETSLFVTLITMDESDTSVSGTQSYMISASLLSEELSSYTIGSGTDISVTVSTSFTSFWTGLLDDTMANEGLIEGAGNDYTLTTGTDAQGNPAVTLTIYGLDILSIRSAVFRVEVY